MPFDGTHFDPRPKRPERDALRERILSGLALGFALLMLILPVSADALIDIVAYFRMR